MRSVTARTPLEAGCRGASWSPYDVVVVENRADVPPEITSG